MLSNEERAIRVRRMFVRGQVDEAAEALTGKRIQVELTVDGITFPDERMVQSFRQFLPRTESRPRPLIQFIATQGGMRTIALEDVTGIGK